MSDGDAQWYKDAVIYQLHVRSFFDSVDDGIGDFIGLTQKLDYLQELGVTALWLLPFYPSPLRDDGYDIANYLDVHRSYGTLADFKGFFSEAHRRGMRVITELVLNHTSDQNPWFQRARRAPPGSPERDFYVWSDTPNKYSGARIIFKDFETSNWTWDETAKAYYWHRFYSHQPDLNFENPKVREDLLKIVDYWLNMGVDGLRLDAVPYLYEREGTNCENLPETHAFLRELRRRTDEKFPNRMLLAEANQWPEDAISYFGDGDECHAAFHFPIMPRLFMATHMEDRFPIVDILEQTPAIPENCQWFIFLRNHDELTLEMVTDEERDYMYRVYAHDPQARINLGIRRRLAPLLGNSRRKIELMNGLLFSLPGTPIIYYGDEIGMGDNIYLGDRNGVRTPMQWSGDRNAGFSKAQPQQLFLPVSIDSEYHFESLNVETQRRNPQSLWWWMKRLIALRQNYVAFSRGTFEMLLPDNQKVLAFVRRHEDESVLVVANLSRFPQYVELDLSAYEGRRPRELFGHTKFPTIGKLPYLLTLGPHAFYWFSLERKPEATQSVALEKPSIPRLWVAENIDEVFAAPKVTALERALAAWLPSRLWLLGSRRAPHVVRIVDVIRIKPDGRSDGDVFWTLVRADYLEGDGEDLVIPLAIASGHEAERLLHEQESAVLVHVRSRSSDTSWVVYEAMREPAFAQQLLAEVLRHERRRGAQGELLMSGGMELTSLCKERENCLAATPPKRDHDRSFVLGDKLLFKLYRRIGAGTHPDLETCRFLTEEAGFRHAPSVLGVVEYQPASGADPMTLGVLQTYIPGAMSGWQFTRDSLSRYFELVLAEAPASRPSMPQLPAESRWKIAAEQPDPKARDLMSGYLDAADLLGQCTGEMHAALASRPDNLTFAPEPITQYYGRSLYQGMRKLVSRTMRELNAAIPGMPAEMAGPAQAVLTVSKDLLERIRKLAMSRSTSVRIRCHGRYHLGETYFTGKQFVVVDFGGGMDRPFSEQRIKRHPLSDVASMLRSIHYATSQAYYRMMGAGLVNSENQQSLHEAARFWHFWASSAFLRGYHKAVGPAGILPESTDELDNHLELYVLEKAIVEVGFALANRPESVGMTLEGLLDLCRR